MFNVHIMFQYETPDQFTEWMVEFVDWFNQLIHKYWYLERFQKLKSRGSQTWVRCQELSRNTGQQTLSILLWSDESRCSEALMCHIVLPQLLLSRRFPPLTLSLSLSLLLSSLLSSPGASCASHNPSSHIHSICLFSVSLSSILSASSLLSSLKKRVLESSFG